jgi:TonB family protein
MAIQSPELPAPPTPGAVVPESDPVAQTLALLQPWIDYVPKHQRRLGLFICLALAIHIAMFFFIRIDSTRAELRHQARTHVTVENTSATSAEMQPGDSFWDRLTDPRLFLLSLKPFTIAASDAHSLDFTALDSNIGPSELPAPAEAGNYEFIHQVIPPLGQRAETALQPERQPFFYDETPPSIATKTTWQWDSVLAQLQPTGVPDLPSPVSDTKISPTELRVAIDADGTVQHVFLEQASQKPEIDQQAVLAARKIRFRSGDQSGLRWGRVTIFWHYAAQPREEVVPTPPSAP